MKAVAGIILIAILVASMAVTVAAPFHQQWMPEFAQKPYSSVGIDIALQAKAFIQSVNPYIVANDVDKLVASFLRASHEHQVDINLLLSVAAAESHFRAEVVSHKGCVGIMQIKPSTARALGVDPSTLTDPAVNINAGARYLRQLLNRFHDSHLALAAYNSGPSRVQERRIPAIHETREYVGRIGRHMEVLSSGV